MKRGTLNLIGALAFMILALGFYFFIWRGAGQQSQALAVPAESYPPVDITSIEPQAEKLVAARENNAGIPLPTPTDKMGQKSDPFAEPQ